MNRRRSLLIIECDHLKLKAQGLSLAQEVELLTQGILFPRGKVDIALVCSDDDLKLRFIELAEDRRRYKRILVIGHSSSSGICLTAGALVPWRVFSKWIDCFEPEILYLVGCDSGLEESVTQICGTIESVREIIGANRVISKMSARLIYSIIAEPHLRRSMERDVAHAISKVFLPAASLTFNRWRC